MYKLPAFTSFEDVGAQVNRSRFNVIVYQPRTCTMRQLFE